MCVSGLSCCYGGLWFGLRRREAVGSDMILVAAAHCESAHKDEGYTGEP